MAPPPNAAQIREKLTRLGFTDEERGRIAGLLVTGKISYDVLDDSDNAVRETLKIILAQMPTLTPAPAPLPTAVLASAPFRSSYHIAGPTVPPQSPFGAPPPNPYHGLPPYPIQQIQQQQSPFGNVAPNSLGFVFGTPAPTTPERYDDDEQFEPTAAIGLQQQPPAYSEVADQRIQVTTCNYVPSVGHKISKTHLSMISIKAPATASATQPLTSLDLVLVIDVSGSMSGAKIALVIGAMKFVIRNLSAKDRVSIVLFESSARKLCPLTILNEQGKQKLINIVDRIAAGGGTMISTGLETAMKILQSRRNADNVASILLLSDGQDGDPNRVKNMRIPYQTHTFGFGGDHDADLLNRIATNTDGVFCFVESLQDVSPAFANCVGGLTSMFAKKIELQVEMQGNYKLLKWQTRFQSSITDGKKGKVEIPDIYSEEARDFVLDIEVPVLPQPKVDDELLKVVLSYTPTVGNQERVTLPPVLLTLHRPEVEPSDQPINLALDKQNNRLFSVTAINQATQLCEQRKFVEAQKLLKETIAKIQKSSTAADPFCVALIGDIQACLARSVDFSTYEVSGRAYAQQQVQQHSAQRAAFGTMSTPMYQNATSSAWVNFSKGP